MMPQLPDPNTVYLQPTSKSTRFDSWGQVCLRRMSMAISISSLAHEQGCTLTVPSHQILVASIWSHESLSPLVGCIRRSIQTAHLVM